MAVKDIVLQFLLHILIAKFVIQCLQMKQHMAQSRASLHKHLLRERKIKMVILL